METDWSTFFNQTAPSKIQTLVCQCGALRTIGLLPSSAQAKPKLQLQLPEWMTTLSFI